jgi:sugar fermentation stimulation protein A
LRDRGVYLLLVSVPRRLGAACGALGRLEFEAGLYAYVGRARRGLASRLARHHRREKRLRWHIDYLLQAVGPGCVSSLSLPAAGLPECRLARMVLQRARGFVPRFGCSDCRCPSHLFYLEARPQWRTTAKLPTRGETRRWKSA